MGHPVLTVKLSSKIKLYCIVKTSNIQMWPCKNLLDIDKNTFEKVIWHLTIKLLQHLLQHTYYSIPRRYWVTDV